MEGPAAAPYPRQQISRICDEVTPVDFNILSAEPEARENITPDKTCEERDIRVKVRKECTLFLLFPLFFLFSVARNEKHRTI